MDKTMQKALEADGEKLQQLTGEDHGPHFDEPDMLAELKNLSMAADTAELMLRKDYPGAAASLRGHVTRAMEVIAKAAIHKG